ncbi:hypothetical protein G6O69_01075 [Pseudenhygromyxa sp. WMMC2535]|uniref:hypothetical protein n=1 Tax=Pseudenhygromyxa sp. WMMC2535 TaxID=2712867 RepID=UPI0015541317|nr:hypothetical protein [Pseudenhygromyxa sp. WMMC2535]NVB36403.1 hypothetical protein [Pseudenhygromyxa sp. WMMC2535]
MSDYRLRTDLPRLLRDLDRMDPEAREQRLGQLTHLITGDRIHFPLEADEQLTKRDRTWGIVQLAEHLRRAHRDLLRKHRVRHLLVPERDEGNVEVIEELEPMQMPEPNEPPLAVVLSGPNSTGKSLLGAWLAVRLLGRGVEIQTTTEHLRGITRAGTYAPPPSLVFAGTRLRATYEQQVVTRPSLDSVSIVRDPDFLRDIQRGYDDEDAPSERQRIRRLAATPLVIIEDLGWRHGGKPDFPRRIWSDFFDLRESATGSVLIVTTNLTEREQMIEHIDMRGWERLGGMARRSGGWFDLRGQSRRLGGQAA